MSVYVYRVWPFHVCLLLTKRNILTRREQIPNNIIRNSKNRYRRNEINNKLVKWKLTIVTTWEGRLFHDYPLLPCLGTGTLGANSFQGIDRRIETVRKAAYRVDYKEFGHHLFCCRHKRTLLSLGYCKCKSILSTYRQLDTLLWYKNTSIQSQSSNHPSNEIILRFLRNRFVDVIVPSNYLQ